jgi:hypothetical protein
LYTVWTGLRRSRRMPAMLVGSVLVAAFLPSLLGLDEARLGMVARRSFMIPWLASEAIALILVVCVWLRHSAGLGHAQRIGLGHALAFVPILLITVAGFAPYIGLKTEASFTMFSNLRTEGHLWNHLLLPQSMRVFRFQDELIKVVETSDPCLMSADALLTRFGLRAHGACQRI